MIISKLIKIDRKLTTLLSLKDKPQRVMFKRDMTFRGKK